MATVNLAGLASGFDWNSLVDQLVAAERTPETALTAKQTTYNNQNSAFTTIKSQLSTLQTSVKALEDSTLYDSRTSSVSDSAVASSSVVTGAAIGSYTFNFTQLATASTIGGTQNVGSTLSSTTDVSAVTLATAGFANPITAGNFTVNGKQVAVATTDTLKQVFDKIAAATGNNVTAAYDPASDKITLTSADHSAIVLGSATDTTNFLQATRLFNTGSASTTSTVALGSIRLSGTLSAANFSQAVTDSSGTTGEFKINGVSIAFDASKDTVNDLISRINSSTAGVTVAYDSQSDRFTLTSKVSGDMGIALEDVSGHFLQAAGLSTAASPTDPTTGLFRGKNLTYTINGGITLTSQSNTVTADSSGITGLSVTALKENSPVNVTVASDTSKIKTAIQNFVTSYNTVQAYIDSQTASSTNTSGKVTAGLLASDSSATDISSSLRQASFQSISGLTATINHLADLGIQTSGYSNTLTLSDTTQLDSALANNLSDVKKFFSDSTNGLGVQLDSYLNKTIGDNGTLATHQTSLTKDASGIDDQIASMEKVILADKARLTAGFVAMETAQATINQQMSYLAKQFP